MEKEFVTYGLALKLKELGFDEPCFGMYCEGRFHLLYPNSYKDIPEDFYREVDAPTYSQAFRFIMQFPPLNKWRCNIALYSDGTYSIKDGKDAIYEYLSSESCLEKLIEFIEREK